MNAIEVKNVTKEFGKGKNKFKALNNVSLKVKKGEIYGLLGPNGAGKTTLIYTMSNIIIPDKGTVKILDIDALKEKGNLGKRMNVCFGGGKLNWSFTPKQALAYYSYLYDVPRKKAKKKIKELSELLNFKKFINKEFALLSTGMRQKIVLAKSLLNDPEVLLLDEPTIGLDVDVASEIRDIFKDLAKERGVAILLTSHYMGEVETLCKKVTLLNKGKVIEEGNISKIKNKIRAPDTIYVVLNNYKNIGFVRKISGVSSYEVVEDRLKILTKQSEKTIEPLLKALKKKKKKVIDLEIKNTTLEEAFIKLVRK